MLWCVFILALRVTLSHGKLLAYHYDQYGAFFGGYNVSPEGVSAGSPNVAGQWFRKATSTEGDASALNLAFRDSSFPTFGITGSLRDQIALLSKVLSTLLLDDGYKEDLYELRKRLKAIMEDNRRPLMLQRALSMRRVQAIMDMLSIMDLSNAEYADRLYVNEMLEGSKHRHIEEALVERTLTMMVIKLVDGNDKLLRLFLRFHHAHFISTADRKEVRTHLCPDTAKLLSQLVMKACQSKKELPKKTVKWYLSDLVIEKSSRFDLIKAIAFELDGEWGEKGRACMKSLLGEDRVINYDRQRAFQVAEPVQQGRFMLRHSPDISPYNALFKANVTSRGALIEARPMAQELQSSLDGMSVKIDIVKDKVKIDPVNSRFLVVRLRSYRPNPAITVDDTVLDSEAGEEERTDDFDDAQSSPPEGTTDFDSTMEPTSTDSKRLKIPDSTENIDFDTFICTYAAPCRSIPVLHGDIILMMQHPLARKLSVSERDALVWAWYGTGRERLLQIAATFPNYSLYHAALVERQQ